MSNHEQVYALFIEANPYPDEKSLPETFEEGRVRLHLVTSSVETEDQDQYRTAPPSHSGKGAARSRSSRLVALAAAMVILAGVGALVTRDMEPTTLSPVSTGVVPAHTEQVVAFSTLLEAGDTAGAEALLGDPIDSIWFGPIGQVSDSGQVRDYLEFYAALGVETEISGCVGQALGSRTEVTCDATQTAGALSNLGLDLPPFVMTFSVGDDGIQRIGLELDYSQLFDAAFAQSRFYEFRGLVLRPLGLVQSNGDPVWSKENAELMRDLIDDFVSEGS